MARAPRRCMPMIIMAATRPLRAAHDGLHGHTTLSARRCRDDKCRLAAARRHHARLRQEGGGLGAEPGAAARRDRLPARAFGLRQDHRAARHRRLRAGGRGRREARRRHAESPRPARGARAPPHRHGVPGPGAVPAPDGGRQRGIRAARHGRCSDARRAHARHGGPVASGAALSARVVGRAATAGGAGARAGAGTAPAVAGRAVLQPRRRVARAPGRRSAHPAQERAASPRCWSRTTSTRRSPSPTRSASCARAASSNGTAPTTCTTSRPTASSPISSARACSCPAS